MTSSFQSPFQEDVNISTIEMHTAGEPLRIITSGFPQLNGTTILDKRKYLKENFDHYRKLLMFEPRGHFDMYGVLLVTPDVDDADIGAIFMHNEGYSTMCGHAVIALGRYAIDRGLVKNPTSPETRVGIQCPCGLVEAFVEYQPGGSGCEEGRTGAVRFQSVPSFLFASGLKVDVPGYCMQSVDVSYGGAFYAFVTDSDVGVTLKSSPMQAVVKAAHAVSEAVKSTVSISHPDSDDLAFLYGTIITDGKDAFSDNVTANVCVFADKQVDRSPTGSGVTARIALQYFKGHIGLGQSRTFESGATGSVFTGKAVQEVTCGEFKAVVVEVGGKAFYTGCNTFTLEREDTLGHGFLVQ
ncbi:trans-L-3-hydroxyproline dehydratase-like isoform X1 [Haliotis cracherodii]|uniref:trans-L-3-hydroxyproline dehydratase-like isoform X1 n=1 Tax=Haliotis cracherodii TaxID=6455 RepID=UPI0039EACEC1